eukprot:s125_g7.t1
MGMHHQAIHVQAPLGFHIREGSCWWCAGYELNPPHWVDLLADAAGRVLGATGSVLRIRSLRRCRWAFRRPLLRSSSSASSGVSRSEIVPLFMNSTHNQASMTFVRDVQLLTPLGSNLLRSGEQYLQDEPDVRLASKKLKTASSFSDTCRYHSRGAACSAMIPEHLDTEIGTYRTDSPTANAMTTRLVKTVCASRNSAAFLSGRNGEGDLVRAPPSGLPAVDGAREIKGLEFM